MEGRERERYLDWRHRIGCFEKKETPVSRKVKKKVSDTTYQRDFCVEWEIEVVWKSFFIVLYNL